MSYPVILALHVIWNEELIFPRRECTEERHVFSATLRRKFSSSTVISLRPEAKGRSSQRAIGLENSHKARIGEAAKERGRGSEQSANNESHGGIQSRYTSTEVFRLVSISDCAAVSHSSRLRRVMVRRTTVRKMASMVTRVWWARKVKKMRTLTLPAVKSPKICFTCAKMSPVYSSLSRERSTGCNEGSAAAPQLRPSNRKRVRAKKPRKPAATRRWQTR